VREKSDQDIIESVLSGETEEFSALVLRHQAKVLGFCFSMLAGRQAAEDAAQEIFIKAYRSLEDFRGDSAFSTWLYRIAFNHCASIRARAARSRTESFDAMTESERDKALSARGARSADPPGDDLAARAMMELPENYRAVMAMRLEGEDYRAIADSLGISVDSVKARLRRARVILRDRLRHFLPAGASKITEDR